MQEINLDTRNSDNIWQLKKLIHNVTSCKGDSIHFSSSPQKVKSGYKKREGTLIKVNKQWSGSRMTKTADTHGRWSHISLEGYKQKKLHIFSIYRVCDDSLERADEHTVWFQEYHSLLASGIPNPNPCQLLLDNLESRIQSLLRDVNNQIIVCIDANESLYHRHNNKLQQFLCHTGLIDIHHHCHPHLPETATHSNGSYQIDYTFVSPGVLRTPGVLPSVQGSSILPINYAMISDHRTLFLDLDVQQLLEGIWKHKQTAPTRTLQLNNINVTTRYISKLREYFH